MSQPSSLSAIQVEGLRLQMSGETILENVSFEVGKGEFFSIIGPNGAGKTSLIKCLGRIHNHWTGRVYINGQDLQAFSQRDLARFLSYVPQAEGRTLPFSVFEFVLMGRYPHLSPFSTISIKDREVVTSILDLAGLTEFSDRRMDTLSGGERQMVFIAAALAQGAETLLLDEPTAFLDYRHQVQVSELLRRLNKENKITVISISHDINAACAQSTRVMAMKDGTCLFVETPENTMNSDRLQGLYDTSFLIADHPAGMGRIALMEKQA
ncbi:MAG: ABC transporter ATP-binding protein [Verrucomicrobiota bacterium]